MTETAALPAWARDLIVFDTETTGVDTRSARIVSAFIGRLDADGHLVEEHSWLIDPEVEIPWQAQRVHGISTERARREGRRAADALSEVLELLRSAFDAQTPVVAYNAPYDLSILEAEAQRHNLPPLVNPSPVVDPLVIDKAVDRFRRGKRTLTDACRHYGVTLDDAHQASADAIAAGLVAQAVARAFPEQLDIPAQQLHTEQISWAREQADSFIDYMRNTRGLTDFWTSGAWPVR
jgi:DNA polymerase-3 subunit epsilon